MFFFQKCRIKKAGLSAQAKLSGASCIMDMIPMTNLRFFWLKFIQSRVLFVWVPSIGCCCCGSSSRGAFSNLLPTVLMLLQLLLCQIGQDHFDGLGVFEKRLHQLRVAGGSGRELEGGAPSAVQGM